jgi:predicted nucleotidyltransferase
MDGGARDGLRRGWTAEEVARRLRPLFAEQRVRLVILFGSLARGGPGAAADIDLAVGCDGAVDPVALSNRVIRLLGEDAVDVVDLRRAPPLLAARIAEEGRCLYERDAGAFASFRSLAWRRYVDTAKLRRLQQDGLRRWLEREPGS